MMTATTVMIATAVGIARPHTSKRARFQTVTNSHERHPVQLLAGGAA